MNTDYIRALRVLAQNPKEIKKAEETYKARIAEIRAKEASGNWSPNTIKKEKAEAKATRDRTCHTLADAMLPALKTVKDSNKSFSSTPLDFNSQKVQNALNVLSAVGRSLTPADQASLLEAFRGDHASLRFLQSAFKKNGLDYAARQAGEMMRAIPDQAIEECEEVLGFHSYAEKQGRYEFPAERMVWTHGEFQRMLDRIGAEPDTSDPYLRALDDVVSSYCSETDDPDEERKYKSYATVAKLKIQQGKDSVTAFNEAVKAMEQHKALATLAAKDANGEG